MLELSNECLNLVLSGDLGGDWVFTWGGGEGRKVGGGGEEGVAIIATYWT